MFVQTFPLGPLSTNAYLVVCSTTKQAAVIDLPPDATKVIIPYLEKHGLQVKTILLTHSHWDHIADVSTFKEATQAKVYIHPLDAPNLINPGADRLPGWLQIKGVKPDVLLNEGDTIQIGLLNFEVIHTPGHSPGGVCFYNAEKNALFAGDTLFKGTIGNLSFPTCQPDLMWPSLDKLAKLPPQTKVYPGHGSTTTIGQESWLPYAKEKFS